MENLRILWPARFGQRVLVALKPGESVEAQNAWDLYGDVAAFGVLAGVASSFLSVFTIRLGGSDTMIGLLSALPALVTFLCSIPGSRLIERREPLPVLLITGTLNRLGYLAIALVPSFLLFHQPEGIVLLTALLAVPAAIANVAFTTMFARAVKPEKRAHVVSVRNVLLGVTSTAIALVGGKFLDWVAFPVNYQALFALAFAGSMLSIYYLSRIQLPPAEKSARAGASKPLPGLRVLLGMLRAKDGYARFTWTSFVFQWGLFFTAPLYSIYWVRTLHASDGWVGLINMIGSGATILFYPLWERLTARRGNRPALILTTAGLVGYPLFMAMSPSVEWVLLVSFWGGVFSSGQALSFFNGLLEVCPEENHATRIAAYNTLANVAAFASPLISTALVDSVGIHTMLITGAVMRIIGSALIWQQGVLSKKPRRAQGRP